jgi:Tol biopolymer transport system component
VAFVLVACAAIAGAQNAPDSARRTAPNTDLPLIPTRPLRFTTTEGTWMSLDVSPDGRTIVFDLLGDLYTLPMTGGTATRITSGSGFDGQPRFSPDGRRVVFVSDRSGGENLWIVDADGRNPRALTRGNAQSFISPEWTPDGQYVVTSRSQGGPMDLWMYHKDGGNGLRLTGQTPAGTPAQQGPGGGGGFTTFMGAAPSPEGRYIYANARGGGSVYNQMLGTAWQIVMYDRETGRVFPRTQNLGAGMRPAISPDGRTMAYASRRMAVTGLKLRDLSSGDERWLADEIQRDDMESRGTRDALPGYAWTPDSRAIVITHHGKFWRIDAASGRQTEIAFTAEVDQMIAELARFDYEVNDSVLTVRQIRGPRLSPDGTRLAFSALDQLHVMDWPGGKPVRLTSSAGGEFSPTWSPDGKYLAYVSWSDSGGDIWRVAADGRSRPEKLSSQSAFFDDITYSPTGSRIVATRAPRSQRAVVNDEINPKLIITELVWIPASGGAASLITPLGNAGRPHFTTDSTRIYLYEGGELLSLRWDGTDRKAHLRLTGFTQGQGPNAQGRQAQEMLMSPDGQRVLALIDNKVFLVPVPVTGGTTPTVSINQPNNAPVPIRQVSRIGGDFLAWSQDGGAVTYALGRSTFLYDVARSDSLVADSMARAMARNETPPAPRAPGAEVPRGKPVYEAARSDITISVPKDRPVGTVVLRGARIITMKGTEVIERGDVVVTNNRVSAVGPTGSVNVPAGARTIDVSGKTIMPGLVDVHAHMWPLWGVHAPQPYMYLANLAYGVTTTRDPQTSQTDVITYGDAVETGQMIGPRVYATPASLPTTTSPVPMMRGR